MIGSKARFGATLLGALAVFGCKSPSAQRVDPAAAPSASSLPPSQASAVVAPSPAPSPRRYLPEGPRLGILAGQGVGPIRFGATVATIERLMEAPCELKTPEVCRYIVRAIDFHLKDGAVDRMVIQSHERSAGPDANGQPQVYGFFNGAIPPDVYFGMIPSAVRKYTGEPQSVEQITTPNEFNTVERDTYPGMVIEYDRYKNGNLIMGAVILTKANVPLPKGKAPPPR